MRRHLRFRDGLGDPEVFLPAGARRPTLELARKLAAAGRQTPATPVPERGDVGGGGQERRVSEPPQSDPELLRLSKQGTAEEILALPDLTALRAVASGCRRCALHRTRTNVVFADGSPNARVLCVGEAPGQREDATGLPFVGPAGKLMDRLLLSVGLPRHEVFICNVLKCRPPGNRNPLQDEIESCSPFLLRQVELVRPGVIVAFGTFAAQTLLGSRASLGRLRGRVHLYRGYPLVVTYHPAALLRNPVWTRPTWEDLQLVRRVADGEQTTPASPGAPAPATAAAGSDPNLQLSLSDQ